MSNCEVLRLWSSQGLNLITILSALFTTSDVAGDEVQRSKTPDAFFSFDTKSGSPHSQTNARL